MKKRRLIIILFLIAVFLILGPRFSTKTTGTAEGTEDVILSEEEKDFLKRNSVNEEAVERGELKSWQIKMLYEYRACRKYLYSTYPEHRFSITTVDAVNQNMKKWVVYADGDKNDVFYVIINSDGKITDTWNTIEDI